MPGPNKVSIPLRLLQEGVSHVVEIELLSGDMYRGTMLAAEDTMNIKLANATFTRKDGKVSKSELVFIRGSQVRFIVLPEVLRHHPMFETNAAATRQHQEE